MKKRIYNIPASCPFVDVLARNFLAEYRDNPLELADVLFLLPNRRACQSLREAFVREQGLAPTLLPQMRPIADVEEEVKAGYEILKALDLRHRGIRIVSCPTCARRGYDVQKTIEALEERLSHINEPLSLAVMGCVVNGPGEAGHTDFGVCGGKGDENMIFIGGKPAHKVKNADIVDELVRLVEEKVKEEKVKKVS